ncbi:MAG: low temperature requirement protein A [Phaeodactylibacter sp.]|nr:low temperature requirement protein A [Phaeodactylibacter sp.]
MFERLGLFAIIVFGEVVIGVVNGIGGMRELGLSAWLNFALALSIVFVLWWIFFTLISRREPKGGFLNATLLELLYIPALISLGLIAVSFTSFFQGQHDSYSPETLFGYAVTMFLICISLMIGLLEFPDRFRRLHRPIRVSLLLIALAFLAATLVHLKLGTLTFLVGMRNPTLER